MDEQPVQLLKETRTPILGNAQHPQRVDFEYERAGTANILMFTPSRSPAGGKCRCGRGKQGGSGRGNGPAARRPPPALREGDSGVRPFEHAYKGRVLRSVRSGARSETGASDRVSSDAETWQLAYPCSPAQKAECEPSYLTRQCVSGRRFADIETLQRETAAWCSDGNNRQRGANWPMKLADAKIKLKSIYPRSVL